MSLALDYAWQHPDPAAIKADGYSAVLRYLSHDPTKDLTVAEAAALHKAGLSVGIVFETTAQRAAGGETAGRADVAEAEQRATAMGYPLACPIFYAVDYDADPTVACSYFKGIRFGSAHPVGVYGGLRVVQAVYEAGLASAVWQATAWSSVNGRTVVYPHADLFQRIRRTMGPLAGVRDAAWDEDAICNPALALWAPGAAQAKPPARPSQPASRGTGRKPLPTPKPSAHPLLVVDGKFGPKTVAALQAALHVKADGVFGIITAGALQRHLGCVPDGDVGPRTVTTLQRHVRAHVDGLWPSVPRPHGVNATVVSDTTRHLQSALNGNAF